MNDATMPAGYKRTEIGIVPNDWEVKYLKEISPRQCVGLVINPSTYFDDAGDVPMLVGSNVMENSINWEWAKRITTESNLSIPASRIYAGDLVMVRVGEPGVTAVVPPELDGCNCASIMIVRKHGSFNSQWLCYVMNSSDGRGQVEHVQYGTAQKQFNISHAIDFRYAVPPLAEQEAIAEALADADALIESLAKLVAKKRHLKQAAMQKLLTGKKRLPGFECEWTETTLGELCSSITDGTHYTPRYVENGVPFYSVENVTQKNFNDTKFISDEEHAVLIRRCKPERGDILLTRIGSLGETKLIDWDVNASIYVSLALLKPKPSVCSEFLYSYTKSRQFVIDVENRSLLNASPKKINMNEIAEVPVQISPTQEEQADIAKIILDMDSEIEATAAKLAKACQIKQGMMQELLTGRTRLV